ncbi:YjbE family putative metal transport protein [Asticcacaulis sp. EMRT-3]|uniref:YjbE family putative metal transport protein n=1 Tax=Asticcacaulis sp. EMRT-3 TaxID=3040349 RepID=UPI0024AE97CA|nr:YjbE family putative metal transport protein [Asticcacaulis sp. EMRT-3]MDI7774611.1 YjbE family putative metal transport protein [Asticcacaulis sp. EMRT-3]
MSAHMLAEGLVFLQVVFIDIVMAGDNAVAVGLAAAGLPVDKRRQAIAYGLIGATILRIGFVLLAVQLLQIVGLLLAGGLLLLWVCWKMWRELRHSEIESEAEADSAKPRRPPKTLLAATLLILGADISMSLDNVLAVTGAAEDHIWVLAFGLLFSIAAMGFAANLIASLLHRHRWIGYAGLLVVTLVAFRMIWEGGVNVWDAAGCDLTFRCVPAAMQDLRDHVAELHRLI